MNFYNYEKASDYKVQEWIEKSIVELTTYQKQRLRDDEIVRFAPFQFYQKKKKVESFWLRLTIIFFPFVWLLLLIFLPISFLITGRWGYSSKTIDWFGNWINSLNISI